MEIHDAAESGDLTAIKLLTENDASQLHAACPVGDSPLHLAIHQGKDAAAKLLIELGANVNAVGNQGQTPLHAAASSGSVEIARILLRAGANLEARDEFGQTPLKTAVYSVEVGRRATQRLVELLKKSGAEYDIESAVVQEDVTRVREILAANPNAFAALPKEQQAVIIHTAIHSAPVLALLLKTGGDANARTREKGAFRFSPITRVSDAEVAKLLIEFGADVNAVNSEGKTPLEQAIENQDDEMKSVLEAGIHNRSTTRRPRS